MAGRGKTTDNPPDHTLMEEADESILDAAQRIFEQEVDDIPDPRDPFDEKNDPRAVPVTTFGRPDQGDFVQLRGRGGGGAYLPARRRIMWMRGDILPHPDWTIETREIKVTEGAFSGSAVKGGYARIEASIYDSDGRLIAMGRKTEYSERFLDFVEKAETGAIARALAVAGYGTEAALDLDEGVEEGRIADAPVSGATAGRPITITASSVAGLKQGGRSEFITDIQVKKIVKLAKDTGLGLGVTSFIEAATGVPVEFPPSMTEEKDMNKFVLATIRGLTYDEGGTIIQALQKAAEAKE